MIKMPCLFVRDFHGHNAFTLTTTVTPECAWVLNGEGTASRKRDGTACMFLRLVAPGGQLLKRYDAKKDRKTGRWKDTPDGGIPCGGADPVTGHWPFWVPIGPHDYWHAEALALQRDELVSEQTYELCGPKLQGNPEGLERHVLIPHGKETVEIERSFEGVRTFLESHDWEGIVFRHPDGRFAKIRRKDFGMTWPLTKNAKS